MLLCFYCRRSRATFDNTEVRKEFGPVVVHYGNVQKKVNDKYDMWHKEVLTKFGGMLGQSMQDFHATVTKVNTVLEESCCCCCCCCCCCWWRWWWCSSVLLL